MARRGRSRAQVAVAQSILVSAYYMLSRDESTAISNRTGCAGATTRHTPAGWSPSWSDSATPWSWIRPPDRRVTLG
jgi:hypothetical protein